MSRNIGSTCCDRCNGKVKITGAPYQFDRNWPEFDGMTVADAECVHCRTLYTAWIGFCTVSIYPPFLVEHGFYDLSYRKSFNDEPHKDDVPPFGVDYFAISRDLSS